MVELMVALTISLFLIGGMAAILQNVKNTYTEQQGLAQLQDNARLAMTLMTDVIESAGYFPNPLSYSAAGTLPASPSFSSAGTPVITGSTTVTGDSVTVRYAPDNTADLYNCMGGTNSFSPYDTWENTFSAGLHGRDHRGPRMHLLERAVRRFRTNSPRDRPDQWHRRQPAGHGPRVWRHH